MANILQTLLGNGPTTLRNDLSDWSTETFKDKQVLFYKGKNYIPKDTTLRRDLIRIFHDHETAGHPGELETYNAVRQHYWWPGLRSFVKTTLYLLLILKLLRLDNQPWDHPNWSIVLEAHRNTIERLSIISLII